MNPHSRRDFEIPSQFGYRAGQLLEISHRAALDIFAIIQIPFFGREEG
jgi:hypothetical protein